MNGKCKALNLYFSAFNTLITQGILRFTRMSILYQYIIRPQSYFLRCCNNTILLNPPDDRPVLCG
ncbi:hypothetical protein CU499_22675 [Salmonella enterica]|nr:hypothetical protein [Salmonella enterica]